MKISKTVLITLFASTIISLSASAQKGQSSTCIAQGNILIDAFYGYPYVAGALVKGLGNGSSNLHNLNHLGGKVEYMVSDKIGLGAIFTYADTHGDYQDSTGGMWYTAGIKKMRILGAMNFHFATTSSVDPYFVIGAGYKQTTFFDTSPNGGSWAPNLLPVAIRVGVGMHYYFTDFMGINAEVGIGGPIMQGGLSFKF